MDTVSFRSRNRRRAFFGSQLNSGLFSKHQGLEDETGLFHGRLRSLLLYRFFKHFFQAMEELLSVLSGVQAQNRPNIWSNVFILKGSL